MAYEKQTPLTWRAMWHYLGWGRYPLILAAGAVAIAIEVLLWAVGTGLLLGLGVPAGVLAAGYVAEQLFAPRHTHCERCDRCSLLDSPARRRRSTLRTELAVAGWSSGGRYCQSCAYGLP